MMTCKLLYCIPLLIALAFTSKVSFDYNNVAVYQGIDMVCSVKDREQRSLIKIQHGGIYKVTVTNGCIMKSNDTRLSISCTETEDDVLLSVTLTDYNLSDLGIWNCSDGESYDTVTFADFVRNGDLNESRFRKMTFNCMIHEECHLSLFIRDFLFRELQLRNIDGSLVLVIEDFKPVIRQDGAWRERTVIADNKTFPYLNLTLLDVDISDAGIFYLLNGFRLMPMYDRDVAVVIIKVMDYPTQSVILQKSHGAEPFMGPYELYCASESKSQPMFIRKPLSYTWRVNGHSLTELRPCFKLSGPVLMLCPDACGLEANGNIAVTCFAEEDGLRSSESQPLMIPASRVISDASAEDKNNLDHKVEPTTGTLIGACLGSFIIGAILAVLSTLFVMRKGALCNKEPYFLEHKEEEGNRNINDTLYINSVMADTHKDTEIEVRQYEALDHSTMEHCPNQYDVIYSKESRQKHKEDTYEAV